MTLGNTTAVATAEPVPQARPSSRAILEDVAAFGTSRYLAFGVSFVVGIAQRGLLGPQLVGVWQVLGIARQYLSYADLGVLRGAELTIPALIANRDPAEVESRNTVWTSVLLSTIVVNAALVAASFYLPWAVDPPQLLWGFRVMALIAVVEAAVFVIETTTLRVHARFKLLSLQVLGSELLFSALSIPAILVAGLWGLLGTLLISLLFKIVFMRWVGAERMRVHWDVVGAFALMRLGFPLTMYALLVKTFDAVDRLLLVHSGNVTAIGYYSIASMTAVFLGHVPIVVGTVYQPRVVAWFELRKSHELARYFRESQLCILALAGAGSAACYFAMPFVVQHFLPAFTAGIPAMKIGVLAGIFVSLIQLPAQYLAAARRQWAMTGVVGAALALYYGGSLVWARSLGDTSEWLMFVSWGRLGAYALLSAGLCGWVLAVLSARAVAWSAGMAASAVYIVAVILGVDAFLPLTATTWSTAAARVTAQLAVSALAFLPLLVVLERQTGVFARVLRSREAR